MLPKTLWTPKSEFTDASNMNKFRLWLNAEKKLELNNYQDLWRWSIHENTSFWKSIFNYFEIKHTGTYSKVNNAAEEIYNTKWFEGIKVNYAEHIFRKKTTSHPALVFKNEFNDLTEVSWSELELKTANLILHLKQQGVEKGDRVCSMLPNCPEAVISFLATNAIGAIWTSCSPDFGTRSIIDRFSQIEPTIFIAANGYMYNGRKFDKTTVIKEIESQIPSIKSTIVVDYLEGLDTEKNYKKWDDIIHKSPSATIEFTPIDFNDPIWILYSSGTTGKPKAITHSVGGILLEHFKALSLHQNVKQGEPFFWYSTTGWMMWNYALSSLLVGGKMAIYDGSPAFPNAKALWDFAEAAKIKHFGAGASYYIYCMREGMGFLNNDSISSIESFGSTGSPLPPEAFEWFYEYVNPNAWVISLSGGTDICSGFVGGNPFEPVYEGEIQCRMLGVALEAYNESGDSVKNELGEMIIENALPSMPIYFWNDTNNERYKSSYFEMYPGKWRHGDWIKITERNTVIIYGRSDTTLNRGGVRIGTSEVYSAAESIDEISDSLVVCIDYEDGTQLMPLFVQLKPGFELDLNLKKKIKKTIKTQYSPRHIPDKIIAVKAIPYTISGKKMEAPVKKILSGIPIEKAANLDAMKNPKSLDIFAQIRLHD